MSRQFRLSASALVAVAVLFGSAARGADEPKDIIEKAIKAHGGGDVLAKYKAGQLKTKGTLDLPGVGEIEFTQETSFMLPNKFRDSIQLSIGGKNISTLLLVNGDKVSIEVEGKAIEKSDEVKEALKDVAHVMEIGRLVTLKDEKYKLDIIGEDKVEGKKVMGVRVSMKDKKDVSLYFDKETWLLAKLEHRTVDAASGNEVSEERIVTEYKKDKNGVPVPKSLLVKRDGKKLMEAEVLEMQMLEKLDDDVFTK